MYPPLSAGREETDQGAMLNGLPAYFMASFYPHMEVEMLGGGAFTTDAEPMDRALVASRNHREAERRRRERIKCHLDRLRAILACDPKTDKASLLAKVVERVRDLKQRTEAMAEAHFLIPGETDEIAVLPSSASISGHPSSFEASLCCEDRSDLLPELVDTLRSLRLKTLRAEFATLGGRVRNVLILAKDDDDESKYEEVDGQEGEAGGDAASILRDALKALVERSLPAERCKRRRLVELS